MKATFWRRGHGFLLAGLIATMAASAPWASAADTTWTAGSGNFTNAANWSAGVPDANTNANFTSASSYTVSFTSDAASSNTYFNPSSGTVTLDLGANTWTTPGQFWIGQSAGANSTVVMSNGALVVTNAAKAGDFTVGRAGSGAFTMNGGTILSDYGAAGFTGNGSTILLSGPSTIWSNSTQYTVGYYGNNSRLVVSNQATLVAGSGILRIGHYSKSNLLVVADGGVVKSVSTYLSHDGASSSGNSALITGSNSFWNNSDSFLVGLNGGGNTTVVSNNAVLQTATLNVGHASGTNALAIYTGGTVLATNVNISLGGTLVSNRIVVAGGSLIATNSTGTASLALGGVDSELGLQGGLVRADKLNVNASALNNAGGTVVAKAFNVANGTVNARDGSTTDVGVATLYIGNTVGQTGRWNVVSGTNAILGATRLSGDSSGIVGIMTVSGAGTLQSQVGALEVGRNGSNALLVITNGARMEVSGSASVGGGTGGGNTAIVAGNGSTWDLNNSLAMFLGYFGSGNQVIITNNGYVDASAGTFYIGYSGGSDNRVTIADGGKLDAAYIPFGQAGATSNNLVLVSGAGSLLQTPNMAISVNSGARGNRLVVTNGGMARIDLLTVGGNGSHNQADILAGGVLIATNSVVLGNGATSASNLITVSGGSLAITNSSASAKLVVGATGQGTLTLNGGNLVVDQFLATNGVNSVVNLHAGDLVTRSTTIRNAAAFTVGDGVQAATLKLNGGAHLFADGLSVASNGTLTGTGAITAAVTVANGGALAPGMSPGTLTIHSNLTLSNFSALNFELGPHDLNGIGVVGGDTNDLIVVNGDLILDGILNVTALPGWDFIGNTPTNVFRLFNYTGVLTDHTLSFGLMPGGIEDAYFDTSVFGEVNLIVVIPEPSSFALLALVGIGWLLRRRT